MIFFLADERESEGLGLRHELLAVVGIESTEDQHASLCHLLTEQIF